MSSQPSRRERNAAAIVERADSALNDRRWDGLRTRGARRVIVALYVLAVVGVAAAYILLGSLAGLAVVVVGFGLLIALRLSVRTVADLPEDVLDERQLALRDAAYVRAYRALASVVVVVASAGLLSFIVLGEDPDTWAVTLNWDVVMGMFWALMGLCLALPSLALALDDEVA